MKLREATMMGLVLSAIAAPLPRAEAQATSPWIYVVKSSGCPGLKPGLERVQTGFQVAGQPGVVTALHGVYRCEKRTATAVSATFSGSMELTQVDYERDVALLTPTQGSLPNGGLTPGKPSSRSRVIGHPLDLSLRQLTTNTELRSLKKVELRLLVPVREHAPFGSRKSPSLDIEVFDIAGALTAGHSGAPVLNADGHVFALVDGGLERGASEIAWAVPVADMRLTTDLKVPEGKDLIGTSDLLYSTTAPVGGARATVRCFDTDLVLMRTVSIEQLVDTMDDPYTFQQLQMLLQSDTRGGLVNVYRSADARVALVAPYGWSIQGATATGCSAVPVDQSRDVELRFLLARLPSDDAPVLAKADQVVIPWEHDNFCAEGFAVDPMWSNAMPRSDVERGIVARRKGYARGDYRCAPPPQVPADVERLIASWSALPKPIRAPKGIAQCGVQCMPGTLLYPQAFAMLPQGTSMIPRYMDGSGFASILTTATETLVSWVRVDGRTLSELTDCAFRLATSKECRATYERHKRWSWAVLSAAATQLTPEWN